MTTRAPEKQTASLLLTRGRVWQQFWKHGLTIAMLVAVLSPLTASARCMSATVTSCVCATGGLPATGVIESIGGSETTFLVDESLAADSGVSSGTVLTGNFQYGDDVGQKYLLFHHDGRVNFRLPIDQDGRVRCEDGRGAFALDLDDAVQLSASDECQQELRKRGFVEPPCHDTGIIPGVGCQAVPSVGLGWSLWLLVAMRCFRAGTTRASRGSSASDTW